jgi:predicted ribosomally synthesized peptide with SipW-like signal peptide
MARHNDTVGFAAVFRRVGTALISARARAIMSIGIVLGLGAVGTLAAWSDTATATSGVFTTGRIDIKVGNPAVDNNPAPFSTALTNTAIIPGNVVSAPLLVSNSGTVPFNYTLSVLASNTGIGALLNSSVFAAVTCGGTALSTVTGLDTSKSFTSFPRSIAVGATDQLCISVTMPSGTAVPALGATGTVIYTLQATSS